MEEWGHYLDTVFNESDSAGDEGEIFASLVKGFNFDLAALSVEDDHANLTIGNSTVDVEQAIGSINLPTRWIAFQSVRGSILAFRRDATVSSGTDIFFADGITGARQFLDNVQAPVNIFNGQFSLVTTRSSSRRTEIDLDGNIRFRSGFIQPQLRFNAPLWTRIQ